MGTLLALLGQQARAQQTVSSDTATGTALAGETSDSLGAAFQKGVRAFEEGRPERAELLLRRVFSAQPAYAPSGQEPAAYWLGRTHAAQQDTACALQVWKAGLDTLRKRKQTSVPLAHAYLQLASAAGLPSRAEVTSEAYRALIGSLGRKSLPPPHRKMLRPYAARLGLILPKSMRRRAAAADSWEEALQNGRFAPEAGEHLLAWWRSQDPLPATQGNERMAEHLRRVAHASKRYAWKEYPTELDDRGKTYVRFGAPYRQHVIRFNDTEFIEEVLRFGVNVARGDFPENEIWTYQNIDQSGKYIFVEENAGHYQLATSMDLLPLRLRRQFGNTERGQNHAYSSLAALRYIYEELSLHYANAGNLYSQVVSYLDQQENIRNINRLRSHFGKGRTNANVMAVGQGAGERVVVSDPQLGLSFPNTFAPQLIRKSENQDRQLARRRAREMPRQYTRVARTAESLPVHVRTARFLEGNGTTRTEIYWSTSIEALALSEALQERIEEAGYEPGAYGLLNFTATQNTRDYQRRAVHQKRYLFEQGSRKGFLEPQTVTVWGDTGLYHLALQWGQHPARVTDREEGREVSTGPRTHLRTYRIDSLRALSSEEGRLEMSDLKPMTVPKGSAQPVNEMMEAATPYPYTEIGSGTPLLLRFEIYHLTFGPNDETQYTVEYEVQRRTERGRLRSLFQGDQEQRTSTQATYTGSSRKVEEYILLDRSDIETGEEEQLKITVRVTDENGGQTKERTLSFGVLPGDRETPVE